MYPIDSPHLQILPERVTVEERHQFLRNISMARAFNFMNKNAEYDPNSLEYPVSHDQTSYFLAQLTIGTHNPPFSPYVIVDPVSDQTWIQCVPCNPCFNLKDSYNFENSTTYYKMDYEDSRCDTSKTFEGSCGFDAYYGKGHAEGYLGMDTFAFSNAVGDGHPYFPNIAFGCGVRNNGFSFLDKKGIIAGVHGFGLGPRSFINQLEYDIKGRFSYCIPQNLGQTTISFGDAAIIKGENQTIAMNPESRYHLHLAAISVNDERLSIDSSIFELDSKDYKTGFFIDPSTPLTLLNTKAHKTLISALDTYFSSNHDINNCYTVTSKNYPKVSFHFVKSPVGRGEVILTFDDESIFRKQTTGFCIDILPTNGPSIFGARQQTNLRILYDINARQLAFAKAKC